MKEINLVPYHIRERKAKELKIRNYIASFVILFCVLFICVYVPKLSLNKLKNEEINLSSQISSNTNILNENIQVSSEINNINTYTDKINFLTKNKVSVADRITVLQKYIPQDVVLSTIRYTKGTINISGTSKNYNSIAEFAANLQASKDFKNVDLISLNYSGESQSSSGKYNFSINIAF